VLVEPPSFGLAPASLAEVLDGLVIRTPFHGPLRVTCSGGCVWRILELVECRYANDGIIGEVEVDDVEDQMLWGDHPPPRMRQEVRC
jgi:hypothetical protein